MLAQGDVKDLLGKFVVAQLWTNRTTDDVKAKDKANDKIKKDRFKLKFIPWYVIVLPDGTTLGAMNEVLEKKAFLEFLDKGLAASAPK